MRAMTTRPAVHLFVCTNQRAAGDPLVAISPGCAQRGTPLFLALKKLAGERGDSNVVWITQTGCLGLCPKSGATVAVYPRQQILTEVEAADAARLYDEATRPHPR